MRSLSTDLVENLGKGKAFTGWCQQNCRKDVKHELVLAGKPKAWLQKCPRCDLLSQWPRVYALRPCSCFQLLPSQALLKENRKRVRVDGFPSFFCIERYSSNEEQNSSNFKNISEIEWILSVRIFKSGVCVWERVANTYLFRRDTYRLPIHDTIEGNLQHLHRHLLQETSSPSLSLSLSLSISLSLSSQPKTKAIGVNSWIDHCVCDSLCSLFLSHRRAPMSTNIVVLEYPTEMSSLSSTWCQLCQACLPSSFSVPAFKLYFPCWSGGFIAHPEVHCFAFFVTIAATSPPVPKACFSLSLTQKDLSYCLFWPLRLHLVASLFSLSLSLSLSLSFFLPPISFASSYFY